MKNTLLLIVVIFGLLQPSQAQNIVGKWYCPQSFLDSLGLRLYSPNVRGYYEFNKDGTFKVRIDGEKQSQASSGHYAVFAKKAPKWMKSNAKFQTLQIKVKGKYWIEGNAITTKVDSDDVYVFIDTGLEYPADTGVWTSRHELFWMDLKRSSFVIAEDHATRHAETIKRERMSVWRWKDLPVTLTDEYLQVGDRFKFTKKRIRTKKWRKDVARYLVLHRKKYSKKRQWVVNTLRESVALDSLEEDMYYLGCAYIYGLGVKRDSAKAVELLEKAAAKGYDEALYELGMMYRLGRCSVSRNLHKAYDYFYRGVGNENSNCMYELGCMFYKGIGCGQSYKKAISVFAPAADFPHKDARALYMLGVCCRNGYGVPRDSALAEKCLKVAAKLKYPQAKEELAREHEETYMHEVYADSAKYAFIPDSVPEIKPAAGAALAPGRYSGFIVTYDWSGAYILDERPLAMTVDGAAGAAQGGALTVGTDTTSYSGTATGGTLRFASGGLTLPDRLARGGKTAYRLDSMVLEEADGRIRGRLNLYSPKRQEPGRPMYFELRRDGAV